MLQVRDARYASPDSEHDSKILGRVQSRAHLSGRPAVHKGEGQMGAQPGVKMASADQGKQIHLPSDQSLGRERELAAPAPDMAGLLIPQEPKTFLCSDRESAGRGDHRSQTCEVP